MPAYRRKGYAGFSTDPRPLEPTRLEKAKAEALEYFEAMHGLEKGQALFDTRIEGGQRVARVRSIVGEQRNQGWHAKSYAKAAEELAEDLKTEAEKRYVRLARLFDDGGQL